MSAPFIQQLILICFSGDQQAPSEQEPQRDRIRSFGAFHHGRLASPVSGQPVVRIPVGEEALLRHGVRARRRAFHQTSRRRSFAHQSCSGTF